SVRRKLLSLILFATLPLVLAVFIAAGTLGHRMWQAALTNVETVTVMMHDMVESTLHNSIESYLRAKVETAITTVEWLRAEHPELDDERLRERIARQLLSVEVAESGYIYVIDNDGEILIHPDPQTRGRTIPDVEPVKTQLAMRSGYLEYSWQNSFEPSPQPKAVYMEEYAPFDWIVSASSYREEFVQLVNRERLAEMIERQPLDAESYSVVLDRSGSFVAHPDHTGRHMSEFFEREEAERIREIVFSRDEGRVEYSWPARRGEGRRPKVMFFRRLPDFDWALATTVYLDSVRRPTVTVLVGGAVLMLLLVGAVIVWVLRMSHGVTDPIIRLANAAESGEALAETGVTRATPGELAALVAQFNAFVARIAEQKRQVARQHETLEQRIEEKTILVREIHHRVKNNLQVIASLLNLQADGAYDRRDVVLFERTSERILSMALVHEQLYQTDDLSFVRFDAYLEELVGHIRASSAPDSVCISVRCDAVLMPIHRAVPCGLIVNELVTNSVQHAFGTDASGSVAVDLHEAEGTYTLRVADTGHGLPVQVSKSLGMTLIEMLADQLEADLEMTSGDGLTVTLRFATESNSRTAVSLGLP
ncbi:MAG: cache domain-containing protein, partial [Spirochaetaceae bacterium]